MAIATKRKQPLIGKAYFTPGCDSRQEVYDKFEWGSRDAAIRDREGKAIFEQTGMNFPTAWSDTAVQIVSQKYFKGPLGTEKRERGLRQMIDRVVNTIRDWGLEGGYFVTPAAAEIFGNELAYLIADQRGSFNSPVWFNVGTEYATNPLKPQCSACFINRVDDNMESILALQVKEGMIFKDGSGSGVNLSTLRSSKEMLSGGGRPSGPLSFMKAYDIFAGQIKSGGKTRRAAIMRILNVDHPDVLEFIHLKGNEEKKIPALVAAGFSTEFNASNNAYEQVFYQNANNSVRVTDDFMARSQTPGAQWATKAVTTGETVDLYSAENMLWQIAEAAWACGDPGMQFDDTTNKWNPVLDVERINGSNPCGEYVCIDDSSCNLASLNLMKFRKDDGSFDHGAFAAAVRLFVLAQEILVGRAGYPTPEIERNSHEFRPIGLGYANLGSYLMSIGVPYDSDRGRNIAAAITSFMAASAYEMSSWIAQAIGPFKHYGSTAGSFERVIRMHAQAAADLCLNMDSADAKDSYASLATRASTIWREMVGAAGASGFRNAQVTLLAPTGTIGFMMDCATTGVEPELSLVKYKSLVGGGQLKLVNPIAEIGLRYLYSNAAGPQYANLELTIDFMKEHGHVVGAPGLAIESYEVFDTSFPAPGSDRFIDPMGHVKMMQAVQPFLSGAISKTVNLPETASIEDVKRIYVEAWNRGLKSVAVYRDGCKKSQPLNLTKDVVSDKPRAAGPVQHKMKETRHSLTHEFKVGGSKAFLIVGLYDDGSPGEIFLDIAKEGSTLSGMVDAWAIAFSFGLQYGVPLTKLIDRFSYMRFDPSGFTPGKLGFANSIVDYVVRWLEAKFVKPELPFVEDGKAVETVKPAFTGDAPPCTECGAIMIRSGSCFRCPSCGGSTGCN